MSFSSSHPHNETSTVTEVTTKNLNTSGNTGTANVASEGGSVETMTSLVNSGNTYSLNADVANRAIDASVSLSRESDNFALAALGSTQDVLGRLNSSFVQAVSSFEDRNLTTLGNTVSALNQIAKEQNQSANQLVVQASEDAQASLNSIIKNIAIAVVSGLVLYGMTRKGARA